MAERHGEGEDSTYVAHEGDYAKRRHRDSARGAEPHQTTRRRVHRDHRDPVTASLRLTGARWSSSWSLFLFAFWTLTSPVAPPRR